MSWAVAQPTSNLWNIGPRGFSETFDRLEEAIRNSQAHATEPLSLGWKGYLCDRAKELEDACSKPGWDGYDATPVSSEAVARALLLIELLPEWIQLPELAPSPEGEISFEWYSERDRILSVTPQKGLLIYAAVLGPDHTQYGKAPVRDSWPDEVLAVLSQFFSHAGHSSTYH